MPTALFYQLEIAPLVILPLTRSPFFSYVALTAVPPGSLVTIPFGKQSIQGVVFQTRALETPPPRWLKRITAVEVPVCLTGRQRTLAEFVSTEYYTPLGRTLVHFLPRRSRTRKKSVPPVPKRTVMPRATREEKGLIAAYRDPDSVARPGYLDVSGLSDPVRTYALLAQEARRAKRQTLLLVPEIPLILPLVEAFRLAFPDKEIAVLHSQLSAGVFFEQWEKVRSGAARIVIATRQGLFAPFADLGAIIVTEEQDESYKQWDMSPRYDARRVAAFLAEQHAARLTFASPTPSVESVQAIRTERFQTLIPLRPRPKLAGQVAIVNLRLERYRKNYSALSEPLTAAIRSALSARRQVLLYIHRQGTSAFSVCESCRNIFRCPDCGHALIGTKEGHYRCPACAYRSRLFPNCPTCGHLAFRNVGFGTERVEREVRRLFPGARALRMDGSTMHQAHAAERVFEKLRADDVDILIGTQMALKGIGLSKPAVVGIIDADSLLSFPDFRGDERLFHIIARAVGQVAATRSHEAAEPGVFVQTFHPESAFFQRLAGLDEAALWDLQLKERESLGYPPFTRLLRVTCQAASEVSVRNEFGKIRESLLRDIPKESLIRISPPLPSRFLKRKQVYESLVLIRVPVSESLPPAIVARLRSLGRQCQIDVDPLTLFS